MFALPSAHFFSLPDLAVSAAQMRKHPIGTGPFKSVEMRQNESIKLVKNPDYWKKGLPYLDGIEYTIISSCATAVLAFVGGKVDMTFPAEMTATLGQGHQIAWFPTFSGECAPSRLPSAKRE
jgi:peptide/nickel transport system substrate-binding protein